MFWILKLFIYCLLLNKIDAYQTMHPVVVVLLVLEVGNRFKLPDVLAAMLSGRHIQASRPSRTGPIAKNALGSSEV